MQFRSFIYLVNNDNNFVGIYSKHSIFDKQKIITIWCPMERVVFGLSYLQGKAFKFITFEHVLTLNEP